VPAEIVERQLGHFARVDAAYASGVRAALSPGAAKAAEQASADRRRTARRTAGPVVPCKAGASVHPDLTAPPQHAGFSSGQRMSASETAPPRDRFLAFAFAGADLLVEATPEGVIRFAAGAFRQRMDMEPEDAVGRHLRTLVASPDRQGLTIALNTMANRGRVPPMVVRLNDRARTPATFAALLVPSSPPRICVTLGPVPIAPRSGDTDETERPSLARETEAWLREGGSGDLALLEVCNWNKMQELLSGEDRRAMRAGIAEVIAQSGADGTSQEIAEGRYGLLVRDADEVGGLVRRLDAVVRGHPAGEVARVDGLALSLGAGVLTPAQSARALRYTLSRFRTGGTQAARALGHDSGLPGVLAQAALQAGPLRTAIAERRFQLQFQPVVSLLDRRTHHFEALLRPAASLLGDSETTQDFVLSVEAMGLTEDLDCAVIEMALSALRAQPEVSVAVNISALSIQSANFGDRLMDTIEDPKRGGSDMASRLLLELTETVEIDDMATASDIVAAIRAPGVAVCLDDFGTGAAAFRYLREFQVDYVKIDGAFVRRARLGPRERSFVTSIVDLAGAAGARVIAEMVETEDEAQLMRLLGVEYAQGWLFGRPGRLPGKLR
jgi:EAL domain-containing protein (putative c-di-GMP-specific phosphodiesterase class I)